MQTSSRCRRPIWYPSGRVRVRSWCASCLPWRAKRGRRLFLSTRLTRSRARETTRSRSRPGGLRPSFWCKCKALATTRTTCLCSGRRIFLGDWTLLFGAVSSGVFTSRFQTSARGRACLSCISARRRTRCRRMTSASSESKPMGTQDRTFRCWCGTPSCNPCALCKTRSTLSEFPSRTSPRERATRRSGRRVRLVTRRASR
mmetsp:Transcript_15472/g.33349  ORF Transcript_15472/g.33349 Transcript_15472/m.33349 type:complete len:201 (-) Transcript_15472:320-922(-)